MNETAQAALEARIEQLDVHIAMHRDEIARLEHLLDTERSMLSQAEDARDDILDALA